MAVYGVDYTLAFQTSPVTNVSTAHARGRVRHISDSYEAATLAAGDIYMGGSKIPAGATVIDWILDFDDLSAGTTSAQLFVGATALTAAIDTDAAASYTRRVQADGVKDITTESAVIVTTAGAGTSTGTIAVTVFYVID
jgi:hypothetical protein